MAAENFRGNDAATRRFFDQMSVTYDQDVEEVGWDPVHVVQQWPFMVYPGEAYLDVGCGTGALLEFFQGAQRDLHGMDLSLGMIERARRRDALRYVHFEQASAAGPWPFASDSFDKVTALAMFEFVEHLDAAFDELSRVMRPHARALISVEDLHDWDDKKLPLTEMRYNAFPLWRRSLDEIDLNLPPALKILRTERQRGYKVIEHGFTTAYHILELEKVSA